MMIVAFVCVFRRKKALARPYEVSAAIAYPLHLPLADSKPCLEGIADVESDVS
jgi:hypothetical protein